MVRLKDRYLLVTIIYSDVPSGQASKGPVSDLLLFNQPTTDEIRPQWLLSAIRKQVATLFGDCGSGAIDRSLQVKYLSPATSTFILRVSRAHYRLVWAALTFMNSLPTKGARPCTYRVVRVSGTIRKVEEEAIRRAKLLILAAKEEMAGKSSGAGSGSALDALFGGAGKDQARSLTTLRSQDDDDDDDSELETSDG